jgi:hypothetical protein
MIYIACNVPKKYKKRMYHNLKVGGEEGGGDKVEYNFKKEMF